ncbi:MAG TPA: acyl carrier protein [Candidatus Enterocloster excrementipullorum]|uniref:Acyl carrier protein n=1 Tax=Candidatus Enterocloster excrementipullorum TaxID=2838559 RepID=A0A9D2N1T9_9FIRM|nr:acyl carrier protein [Candidatus Enterocloster excrementipullorum]
MSREEVFEKLDQVFQDVFDDESLHVTDETTAADVDGWDSLEHIDLMASVERAFGIRFSMGEITRMKNVGEMADLILEKREQ